MSRTQQEEVDRNYAAFQKLLPSLLPVQHDKYTLMKDEKIFGVLLQRRGRPRRSGYVHP